MASAGKRKRTLAEELTELTNPAPATDVDVEDALAFGAGAGAALIDSDGEEGGARAPSRRAPEGGLRLRARIELEGGEYTGRRTSRAEAGLTSHPAPRRPAPASDDDEDEEDEEDEMDGDEDEEDEDEGDDSLDIEGEFDDSEGDDGDAVRPRGSMRGSAGLDAEAAALEAELAAVAAAEAAAAASLRARAGVERAQARAVANQRAIWERSLALRIGLQKALTGAARLPGGAARHAARAAHPPAAAALDSLAASAAAAAEELASLIVALCARHPELAPAVADMEEAKAKVKGKASGNKGLNRGGVDVDALWDRLDGICGAIGPFRDAAFDKWHAKASLAGSAPPPKGGGLRALNQPPSAQVAALLRDGARARLRAAPLASAAPQRLCHLPAAAPAPAAAAGGLLDAVAGAPRDEESYDDAEFYAQLLKELLEASGPGEGGMAAQPRAPKQRKAVDRRASKGRRLRYAVIEKLVNFMPPAPRALPPQADQLLRRLFGAAPRTIAAPGA